MDQKHPYWKLTKFLLPLALTVVAQDIGEQALIRSLSSSTNAVVDLASFGLAYKMLLLFTGAIEDFKYVSIILLRCRKDRRKFLLSAVIFAVASLVVLFLIGFTSIGNVIINDLHDVSDDVGMKCRKMLYILSFLPIIDAVAWVHAGILIKYKHSIVCGIGSISDVVAQVVVVIICLQTRLRYDNVIIIPLIAAYAGVFMRAVLLVIAYYKYVHNQIPQDSNEHEESDLSVFKILRLWAPLMAVRLCQRVSRPVINLFVARDRRGGFTQADATKALAILSVLFPLCHVPYGWLNELRAMEATFTKKDEHGNSDYTVKQIRFFSFLAFCVSAFFMIILFWIPGVGEALLITVSNVDASFAALSVIPMKIMSLHPIPVINRSIATGWLLKVQKTSALYPSSVIRLSLIIILAITLPMIGLHGAVMGTTALFCGFVIDALAVLVAAAFIKWKRKNNSEDEEKNANDENTNTERKLILCVDDDNEETPNGFYVSAL